MVREDVDGKLVEIERVAVELAERAGRLILENYRQVLTVDFKDKHRRDPVTETDRAVESLVEVSLRERFPDHSLLGEEGALGDPGAEYLWVVDPLDGTKNFVGHLPVFASSVGVLWRRRPVVGAIFLPWSASLGGGVYHARRGGGAFVGEQRIYAASSDRPEPVGLVSLPAFAQRSFRLGKAAGEPRTLGSAAGELALVASGVFQYGLFRSLKIWDVAAGVVLIQEAGGLVYRWKGWPWGWGPLHSFSPGKRTETDPTGLRSWSDSLLAGGVGCVRAVSREARPTLGAGAFLRRLLRRGR